MQAPDQKTFGTAVRLSCSRKTSADPGEWTTQNPTWGHCAVVALAVQAMYGGEIARASLETDTRFAKMRSHYWNVLPDGESDFTAPQFGNHKPVLTDISRRTRAELLANEKTAERYRALSFNIMRELHPLNPLFHRWNSAFRKCYVEALKSPCQKMQFGAYLWTPGEEDVLAHNRPIGPLAHVCQPQCIRLGIKSRTQSMIGACGHAEEHAMIEAIRLGIDLREARIGILGVHMNGRPWIKEKAEHTCLRCAVQMHMHGIAGIMVPVKDKWVELTTEEAVRTANEYAMVPA